MSNFKSGSGNLDFGESDEDTKDEAVDEHVESQDEQENLASDSSGQSTSGAAGQPSPDSESSADPPTSDQDTTEESVSHSQAEEYPYFVRRSNVGDERNKRLEIHVRDKVADQEAEFRNELAEHLGTNEVSKTDAREFALLAAFHHPDRVAELMEDEGFGALR